MPRKLRASALPLCCAGSLFVEAAAFATTQQPAQEPDITVIGQKLREEVTHYVAEVGVARGETPAARWVDPVCPQAVGLSPDQGAKVEAQIRALAREVGATVAPDKCNGNLVLAFTDDAPKVVKLISKRQSLGDMSYEERKQLETGTQPIRWWYSHEIRSEDGAATQGGVMSPAVRTTSSLIGAAGPASFNATDVPTRDRTGNSNSRIGSLIATSSMRAIRHATIVVDVNGAKGKGLNSVIDFAALVGLAEIRPTAAPPNSILGLFSSAETKRLTRNDLGMLKSLYTLALTRKADQHRRVLISTILKERLSNGASTEQ